MIVQIHKAQYLFTPVSPASHRPGLPLGTALWSNSSMPVAVQQLCRVSLMGFDPALFTLALGHLPEQKVSDLQMQFTPAKYQHKLYGPLEPHFNPSARPALPGLAHG